MFWAVLKAEKRTIKMMPKNIVELMLFEIDFGRDKRGVECSKLKDFSLDFMNLWENYNKTKKFSFYF